jgi:BirA family biotin operon repressor/biotin-[acetyl-CoA-carboxylase] ligase
MNWEMVHLDETDSTNRWLREHGGGDVVVVADYQTSGRGCGTNQWESQRGCNLLFSFLLHPVEIPVREQFRVSEVVSVALCTTLLTYSEGFSIKWPNDIYWHDHKICGMLIENRVVGMQLAESIVGIGLNVNQKVFLSDAPNPVSLCQIVGHDVDRMKILHEFLKQLESLWTSGGVGEDYRCLLYRRNVEADYADAAGRFRAILTQVESDGRLVLTLADGQKRRYAFKEVSFIYK